VKSIKLFAAVALCVAAISSCDEEPEPPNQEELITSVNLTLTPSGIIPMPIVTLSFLDLDGDGGNPPVITEGTLMPSTQYSVEIELLNESLSPAADITAEVEAEGVDHQFFYSSTDLDLDVLYADTDFDGNPIGIASEWTTGTAGDGTITVTLRHQPLKTASGVMDGDITNAGGVTDIQVTFDIEIQ
jgi:hypothetical protein